MQQISTNIICDIFGKAAKKYGYFNMLNGGTGINSCKDCNVIKNTFLWYFFLPDGSVNCSS